MIETSLQIKDIGFYGDILKAAKDENGKVYAGVSYICNGIGFTKHQKDRQIANIQTDEVLSRGCLKFEAGVFDSNNETIGILIDFLPLWLAKISITPAMKRDNPTLVEKLIQYQLKAKDVLAAAFLPAQVYTPESEILKQLQKMQYQIEQQNKCFTKAIKEKEKEIRIVETEVFRHPISEKMRRVLDRMEEDFAEEIKSKEFQMAFTWICNSKIKEKQRYIQSFSTNNFWKDFQIHSYTKTPSESVPLSYIIKNIQYDVNYTESHAMFLLSIVFMRYYYGNSNFGSVCHVETKLNILTLHEDDYIQLNVNGIWFLVCPGVRYPIVLNDTYEWYLQESHKEMTVKEYLVAYELGIALINQTIIERQSLTFS